ncbi:MAG: anti-sigma factor family protein [Treponemataceae bacterium]
MSTCPNKELLSAYVDGEVSALWNTQIAEHSKECESCSNAIHKLTELKTIFANNSQEITFSPQESEDSFEKLQNHLRFRKNSLAFYERKCSSTFARIIAAAVFIFAITIPFFTIPKLATKKNFEFVVAKIPTRDSFGLQKIDLIKHVGIIFDEDNSFIVKKTKLQDFIDSYNLDNCFNTILEPVNIFAPNFYTDNANLSIKIPKATNMMINAYDKYNIIFGAYK